MLPARESVNLPAFHTPLNRELSPLLPATRAEVGIGVWLLLVRVNEDVLAFNLAIVFPFNEKMLEQCHDGLVLGVTAIRRWGDFIMLADEVADGLTVGAITSESCS